MPSRLLSPARAAIAALSLGAAADGLTEAPRTLNQALEVRRHFEDTSVAQRLQRDWIAAGIQQRDSDVNTYKTNGSLNLSWSNAELFSFGMVTVSCVDCYVKGTAYATLVIDGDFNATAAFEQFVDDFGSDIKNISTEAWDTFKAWSVNITEEAADTAATDVKNFFTGDLSNDTDIDWDNYTFPTIDVDFNMNLTEIPETTVHLEFDGLELYMLLDVAINADQEIKIPLYPKDWYQPAGIAIGKEEIGIFISLDLILALDSEVDLSTGVHIAFDDGLAMDIAMFGSDVSTIDLTDGTFEFLPVTVNTTGVVFDATLRLGVTAGLNMTEDLDIFSIGTGASVEVYADLAHFRTNITPTDTSTELKARSDTDYSEDCLLPVIETYEFGLGADAGAYVNLDKHTWGPTPNTSTQVFYTTLYSACASAPTASSTGTASQTSIAGATSPKPALLANRADTSLTLGSATSVYTVTNVICKSSTRNCPVSLQSTEQTVKTSTCYKSVPIGSSVTFPNTTGAVTLTSTFGSANNQIKASSGSPKSYVPPTSSASATNAVQSAVNAAKNDYSGLSESNKKLVIGLCAGIGGALLVVIGALITCCVRRRRTADVHGTHDVSRPFLGEMSQQKPEWDKSGFGTTVSQREVNGPGQAY